MSEPFRMCVDERSQGLPGGERPATHVPIFPGLAFRLDCGELAFPSDPLLRALGVPEAILPIAALLREQRRDRVDAYGIPHDGRSGETHDLVDLEGVSIHRNLSREA